MGTTAPAIPFERLAVPEADLDGGAACLSMVYRSLGKKVTQAEIGPAIVLQNRFGRMTSATHLMTKNALSQGFAAVTFQASHPLQALQLCCESGARAILNHRPAADSPHGQYTVLVDVDVRDVVVHDPFYGPSRHVPHDEFFELWHPRFPHSEIAGYLLTAIAVKPPVPTPCWLCGTPMPPDVACPGCAELVGLHLSGVLGCINQYCIARTWNYICCPACGYSFTLGPEGSQAQPKHSAAGAQPVASPQATPLDLGRLFAVVDKFTDMIIDVPGAAAHPEIKKHLGVLASSRQTIEEAVAQSMVHREAHQQTLAEFAQTAQQAAEAHRKKMEELSQQSGPLDPAALGRALLKNLGWEP